MIVGIADELQSFAGLSKKIENVKNDLTERIHSVERSLEIYRFSAHIALTIALMIAAGLVVAWLSPILSKSIQGNFGL